MSKVLVLIVSFAVLGSPRAARADAGDRWDGVMILEQTGGGVLLGAAGGGLPVLAGIGLVRGHSNSEIGAGIVVGVVGGSIGLVTGVTLGVKLTGDARGGNGSTGATIAGSLGGGVLALVTAPLYVDKLPTSISVGLIALTLVAPPILAYHLTSDEDAADHEKRVVVPLVLAAF